MKQSQSAHKLLRSEAGTGPARQSSFVPIPSVFLIDTAIAAGTGCLVLLLLQCFSPSLKTISEIERSSGLPVLALIPQSVHWNKGAVDEITNSRGGCAFTKRGSLFISALREVRTCRELSAQNEGGRIVLLTGAKPGEGKTTAATAVACALADGAARVLLIDADLRRPGLHRLLSLRSETGLVSVITGVCVLEEGVQRSPWLPEVDVLVSGPVPPFPDALLGSREMANLLEVCRQRYTHIVIDSPPVLAAGDAALLASYADSTLLVTHRLKTSRSQLRRACVLLRTANAKLAGVVMNGVRRTQAC